MKSIKEKQLLVKWAKAMNEPIDQAMVEEVERYNRLQEEIKESIKKNSIVDLIEASRKIPEPVLVEAESVTTELDYPVPPTLDELYEILKENSNELVQTQATEEPPAQTPAAAPPTLAERAAEHITKEAKLEERVDSYQQPDAELPTRSINDLRKKIKFLEDWLAKISLTGPGGGAGDVINLDHPVKVVNANYTFTRRDYYVGVNATTPVTLTLPDSIGFPGRMVVVKDESGNCSSNPITVNGTVDNDPGGFILQMDNGGIQMIYREGWRII